MKTPRRPREPKDKGAALVMVLWGAVVMSIIAAAAAQQAMTSAVVVNTGAELTRARALADGGVRLGWSAFAEGQIDRFSDTWACRNGEDTLLVQLRPETSRIDINAASVELLTALFKAAGASRQSAEEIAAGVISYRQFGENFDDDGSGNQIEVDEAAPEQLEAGQFLRGPFQTIEELGYVPGMDVALFRALADDVSVHSRSIDVELRYASANVRKAVDEVSRTEGLMVGASQGATTSAANDGVAAEAPMPAFEGSLLNVRAIAVTVSGAVFVRDAVVEGPIDTDGRPLLLRYVQGRLRDGEVLPAVRNAPSCAQGFAAIRGGV
jgi:DNA uptake protein ComE-like DNA-binding protein